MSELDDCIRRLEAGDEADRIYAAEDIGFANNAAGVGPLLTRLPAEPSRAVREAIFAALLQIEDDAVIEGALGLLDSEDTFLRNQAVELLRALGKKTIPYLDRAFCDGEPDRRKFVIDIVSRLADAASDELYHRALEDPDLNVVITAIESLGSTRQVQFRQQIERMITPGAHPMLLGSCLEALAQIGDSNSLDVVRRSFEGTDRVPGYLRPSYLKLVGTKGSPGQLSEIEFFATVSALDAAVLNALTSLRNRFPDVAIPTSLARPLQDMALRNPPQLAYQAVRLLSGLSDDSDVFNFLLSRLDDTDKVIRIGAIQAMREAGGQPAETALRSRLSRETDPEILQAWGGKSAE